MSLFQGLPLLAYRTEKSLLKTQSFQAVAGSLIYDAIVRPSMEKLEELSPSKVLHENGPKRHESNYSTEIEKP